MSVRGGVLVVGLSLAMAWGEIEASISAPNASEIEPDLTQVTEPCLAMSPDGNTLYFPRLGDLIAVHEMRAALSSKTPRPAEILTQGAAYDSWPQVSPDGRTLNFVSDRDQSLTDVFALDLASKKVSREIAFRTPGLRHLAIHHAKGWLVAVTSYGARRGLTRFSLEGEPLSSPIPSAARWPTVLDDGRLAVCLASGVPDQFVAYSLSEDDGAKDPETLYQCDRNESIVWGGISPDGQWILVTVREVRDGRWGPQETRIIDLERGEVLHREPLEASKRSRLDTRPAFFGDRVYYPHRGYLKGFDCRTGEGARIQWALPRTPSKSARTNPLGAQPRKRVLKQGIEGVALDPDALGGVVAIGGNLFLIRSGQPVLPLTQDSGYDDEPHWGPSRDSLLFRRDRTLHRLSLINGKVEDLGLELLDEVSVSADGRECLTALDYRSLGRVRITDWGSKQGDDLVIGLDKRPVVWRWSPRLGPPGWVVMTIPKDDVGQGWKWSREKREKSLLTQLDRSASEVNWSADGKWVIFLRDGRLWYGRYRGVPLQESDFRRLSGERVDRAGFDPSSKWIWASRDRELSIYRTRDGARVRSQRIPMVEDSNRDPGAGLGSCVVDQVRLVDPQGGSVSKPSRVVIRDGRIEAILEGASEPLGDTEGPVVDGEGHYLIPGLIDCHVHGRIWAGESLLAYGVTTVRDTGRPLKKALRSKVAIETGAQVGPDAFVAGEIFEGPRPIHGDASHVIETVSEGMFLFDQRMSQGVDLIKVYPTLPRRVRAILLSKAKASGLPTAGHSDNLRLFVTSWEDGLDCLEHVTRSPLYDDALSAMSQSGMVWCPTLVAVGGSDWILRREPGRLKDSLFQEAIPHWQLDFGRPGYRLSTMMDQNLERLVKERMASLKRGFELGVPVVAGTDAPLPGCFHGISLHWEMELLVAAGLSAGDALAAATAVPARVFGYSDRGLLEVGKRADMVLLSANPLEDIRATSKPLWVMKQGVYRSPMQWLRR